MNTYIKQHLVAKFLLIMLFAISANLAGAWPDSCIVSTYLSGGVTDVTTIYLFDTDSRCYMLKKEYRTKLDFDSPLFVSNDPPRFLGEYKFIASPDSIYDGTISFSTGASMAVNYKRIANDYLITLAYPFIDGLYSVVRLPVSDFRVQNSSTRSWISPGRPATLGYINSQQRSGFYLIRAVSKSLSNFGVSKTCSSVKLTLNRPASDEGTSELGVSWSMNSDSVKTYSALFRLAGAFPLNPDSDEPVLFVALASGLNGTPNAYTITAESTSGEGEVLVEIYSLPFEVPL